jgi:hypothetical protein
LLIHGTPRRTFTPTVALRPYLGLSLDVMIHCPWDSSSGFQPPIAAAWRITRLPSASLDAQTWQQPHGPSEATITGPVVHVKPIQWARWTAWDAPVES